jgi:hypothetical protein
MKRVEVLHRGWAAEVCSAAVAVGVAGVTVTQAGAAITEKILGGE